MSAAAAEATGTHHDEAVWHNLSAEVESLLADFLERQTRLRKLEADERRRAASAWDEFAERHGSLGDEFTTL